MAHSKLRLHRTPLDNIVSNLRGEVGEVITSWVLWRWLRAQQHQLETGDLKKDVANQDINLLGIMSSRIYDDIVARLSELAEPKIGQLTFFFAVEKLNAYQVELSAYQGFIERYEFRKKRNADISHKTLPEQWSEHRHIHIPYRRVVRAIAMALRLMKKIDRSLLGPSAPYSWRKGRAKRYELMNPPRAAYLMMPHIRLSGLERCEIVLAEMAEGKVVLTEMPTMVDGRPATVLVAKEWGVLHLGDRLLALDDYPVHEIKRIDSTDSSGNHTDADE